MKKRQAAIEEAYAAQVRRCRTQTPISLPPTQSPLPRKPRIYLHALSFLDLRCLCSSRSHPPITDDPPPPLPPPAVTPPPQWDDGKGSHHPDYNPQAKGTNVQKASRETEELLNAIVKVGKHKKNALSEPPNASWLKKNHQITCCIEG